MPRDRLAALQEFQISPFSIQNQNNEFGGDKMEKALPAGSMSIEMERLREDALSEFFMKVEEIRELLREFKEDLETVKLLHSHVLASPNTNDPLRKDLDDLASRIKMNSFVIRSKLKDVEAECRNQNSSETKIRMKKVQHSALLKLFMESMNEYHVAQSDYRDRCKERIKRQLAITGASLDEEEIENVMEQGNWSVFTQGIITETAEAKKVLAEIEARHNDVLQLEKSIRELHELFVEMALFVAILGEKVDNIRNHVDSAKAYVDEGNRKIRKAEGYQSKARKKKILIILALVLVLVFISLVIYFL